MSTAGSLAAYHAFLRAKACIAHRDGFEIEDAEIHAILKPHQRAMVRWAVRGGRRGLFASFGLGKSVVQLETLRLILVHATAGAGRALIIAPLGVRQEFVRDAAMLGIELRFVRRTDEIDEPGIYLTNYESVRDGKLDVGLFDAASLDEASCLRGFGGTKTFREFMRVFDADSGAGRIAFRFVATATPSPNDTIELLAYAAFLGILDVGQAKTRFFKRNSEKADTLTLHPHKEQEFWMWVASWALFVQRPSDLCECPCHSGNSFKDNASGDCSSNPGSVAQAEAGFGSASATAEVNTSCRPTILCQDVSSVADACDQSTVAPSRKSTRSGKRCSPDAPIPKTKIGQHTEVEESSFASDGVSSLTSSPTWGNQVPEEQSSAATTTEAISLRTATGRVERLKRGTRVDQSSSSSQDDANRSQVGLKSSAPTTGSSTAATGLDGRPNGCSPTCCDKCRCDEGYELPPLTVTYHEVQADLRGQDVERDGQGILLRDAAIGVQGAAREKRDTLPARIEALTKILAAAPGEHFIIWHDLEAERHAIDRAVPGAVSIFGAQDLEEREKAIVEFSNGAFPILSAKPVIAGSGCNFQRHCHRAVFLGIGFKFNDWVQALHRIQRFLQTKPVEIHVIYAETEREILRTLQRKWRQHEEMVAKMGEIIRKFGLSEAAMASALTRSIGCARIEVRGENHMLVNADCVEETSTMPDNSIDLIVTSIPFSTQYEYTPSYNDFGHTDNNQHFWDQMDFLIPQLLRVLRPGRVAAIHVKDRIQPGGINGFGFQTVEPFSDECITRFRQHGFAFLARKTIVTDVVRENNQTYRLGWTEQCKDGSRMGAGMPEYMLLFRKAPSDRSNGYADSPVMKPKKEWDPHEGADGSWINPEGYSRARWQIDAHGYQRSSGDRLLRADELQGLAVDVVFKAWKRQSLAAVYDFEHHVMIGESLEARGSLPPTFMLLPPHSWHPDVWTDVTRMLTLNGQQHAKGRELHLCPLQFDIVDRAIAQFTMPGETVFDPFGGLMTVPTRALKAGRKGIGIELNPGYFLDGCTYVEAAAREVATPSLFDFLDAQAETPKQAAE